jgi:hypothetical protein
VGYNGRRANPYPTADLVAMNDNLRTILGLLLAAVLLWALYTYIFIWHNTPNLGRLLGPDV